MTLGARIDRLERRVPPPPERYPTAEEIDWQVAEYQRILKAAEDADPAFGEFVRASARRNFPAQDIAEIDAWIERLGIT